MSVHDLEFVTELVSLAIARQFHTLVPQTNATLINQRWCDLFAARPEALRAGIRPRSRRDGACPGRDRWEEAVPYLLIGAIALATLAISTLLGFWLGKEASTWCVKCGNPVFPTGTNSDVGTAVDRPSTRRSGS